ncbi:putative Ig domain-containing protein [uncultured Microbacterium sp.]|uniref:alpha/beta hydrolase n=1 Tax=uncultured Microbacterium sp. TaxID=191216 RepID=UPI0028D16885|nr:putative Ig domain-containing protein [uncultured Microbacterium sp.]
MVLALAMVVGTSAVAAQADEVDLTPGPTVVADPNSPTGYTGHFVYYNPTATSVRFVADILLRDWDNPTSTTIYQPSQYRPGLMRGGGAYDVQMTNVGNGYWVHDVPLAAGVNQYWFYVNNNTNQWIADPANAPIYPPDGLTGNARRAFNAVYVPYDAEKQNYAPLAERVIANPREDSAKGTWSYVPIQIGAATRTLGVYLPPGYDPNRAEPYKTIYLQHGSGQDQSDWLNIGSVPIIMDNLLQDGLTEPAVIVTTNSAYLGPANQGYPNITNVIVPFVESNYNVSTNRLDRAWAGLSMGASITSGIINNNPLRFGYYGVWSFNAGINRTTPNLNQAYIHIGCGVWDNLNLCATPTALSNLDGYANYKNTRIAGGHDFNAWPQLFAIFAKDYVWQRGAFVNSAPVWNAGGETQSVDENRPLAFSVAATDPEGDAVTYSVGALPVGASFDAATATLSWTPGYRQSGQYTITFTASDGDRSYSLSSTKDVVITVRDVTVTEQLTALKSAITGLSVPGGVKNALTVKLDQSAKLLAKAQTAQAVGILSTDFVGQVNSLVAEGKLSAADAAALILAAQETIANITAQ